MKPTYYGIHAVIKRLESSPVHTWKIYADKPSINEIGRIVKGNLLYDAHHAANKEESAELFENWADLLINTPAESNTYFMVISRPDEDEGKPGRKIKTEPQQVIFTLYGGSQEDNGQPSFVPFKSPAGGSSGTTNAPEEYFELLKRISILESENINLKNSIINNEEDLEEMDEDLEEEEEDEKENPFTSFFSGVVNAAPEIQTPMQKAVSDIISGFASKLVQSKSPESEALEQIKASAPDAEKLLIILGQKAKENPAQIKDFVNQLLTTFNETK